MIRQQIGFFLALASCHAVAPVTTSANDESLYHDNQLRIEFKVPADWEKRSCPSSQNGTQCLELRPPNRREAPDPAIIIELTNNPLEKTLRNHVLFEKRGNTWVKHGRVGENEAVPVTGPQWRGFEASASCGISDENGFHPAAGTCFTAILSNGARSAVIETDGFESTLDPANVISKSFRFLQ